ncbi:MAG TPA: hypothetical protein VL383_06850 [Gemmatimonadaceae bacterium]|jgi:hypothetical protein|nr:hypothetical protein [Gemmatimonadaceae bacterium]
MRWLILALVIGLAMGYHWGYDEGSAGKKSVMMRTLDRFGTSKVKDMQEAREKRVEEASKP